MDYKIYATFTFLIDGGEKTVTGTTNIEVQDQEDIIKVVLDAGYMNHYVSGSYAGKMTQLKTLLANERLILTENPDEITADDLVDADILIITSPQPTDDPRYDLLKSKLSTEEISVVNEFVQRGGSLIITSKADYKDGEGEYQNAVQSNALLEAIGSNLRVNDAQVVDNTTNEGQPYRLMFNEFTSTKYNLTEGISELGYPYSFYSGTAVHLKDGGDDSNVDFIVKGHATTSVSDADNDGDMTPTDMGNVYALAVEELESGGKVVVSGSTFFSDFEISGDNTYANYPITENIINWLRPTEDISVTTITEVRKDEDKDGIPDNLGEKFKIEGYVRSESEAYTKENGRNNAFFEVMYVQDSTGGITVFGVSEKSIPLGSKVQITGVIEQFD